MLKEYLVVAQEALEAKKEMYLVKQQRLELAQQEMLLFHELSEDNRSIASSKCRRRQLTVLPAGLFERVGGGQGSVQINRKPPKLLVHPTLPFIQPYAVSPPRQLSPTRCPGGIQREQKGPDRRHRIPAVFFVL